MARTPDFFYVPADDPSVLACPSPYATAASWESALALAAWPWPHTARSIRTLRVALGPDAARAKYFVQVVQRALRPGEYHHVHLQLDGLPSALACDVLRAVPANTIALRQLALLNMAQDEAPLMCLARVLGGAAWLAQVRLDGCFLSDDAALALAAAMALVGCRGLQAPSAGGAELALTNVQFASARGCATLAAGTATRLFGAGDRGAFTVRNPLPGAETVARCLAPPDLQPQWSGYDAEQRCMRLAGSAIDALPGGLPEGLRVLYVTAGPWPRLAANPAYHARLLDLEVFKCDANLGDAALEPLAAMIEHGQRLRAWEVTVPFSAGVAGHPNDQAWHDAVYAREERWDTRIAVAVRGRATRELPLAAVRLLKRRMDGAASCCWRTCDKTRAGLGTLLAQYEMASATPTARRGPEVPQVGTVLGNPDLRGHIMAFLAPKAGHLAPSPSRHGGTRAPTAAARRDEPFAWAGEAATAWASHQQHATHPSFTLWRDGTGGRLWRWAPQLPAGAVPQQPSTNDPLPLEVAFDAASGPPEQLARLLRAALQQGWGEVSLVLTGLGPPALRTVLGAVAGLLSQPRERLRRLAVVAAASTAAAAAASDVLTLARVTRHATALRTLQLRGYALSDAAAGVLAAAAAAHPALATLAVEAGAETAPALTPAGRAVLAAAVPGAALPPPAAGDEAIVASMTAAEFATTPPGPAARVLRVADPGGVVAALPTHNTSALDRLLAFTCRAGVSDAAFADLAVMVETSPSLRAWEVTLPFVAKARETAASAETWLRKRDASVARAVSARRAAGLALAAVSLRVEVTQERCAATPVVLRGAQTCDSMRAWLAEALGPAPTPLWVCSLFFTLDPRQSPPVRLAPPRHWVATSADWALLLAPSTPWRRLSYISELGVSLDAAGTAGVPPESLSALVSRALDARTLYASVNLALRDLAPAVATEVLRPLLLNPHQRGERLLRLHIEGTQLGEEALRHVLIPAALVSSKLRELRLGNCTLSDAQALALAAAVSAHSDLHAILQNVAFAGLEGCEVLAAAIKVRTTDREGRDGPPAGATAEMLVATACLSTRTPYPWPPALGNNARFARVRAAPTPPDLTRTLRVLCLAAPDHPLTAFPAVAELPPLEVFKCVAMVGEQARQPLTDLVSQMRSLRAWQVAAAQPRGFDDWDAALAAAVRARRERGLPLAAVHLRRLDDSAAGQQTCAAVRVWLEIAADEAMQAALTAWNPRAPAAANGALGTPEVAARIASFMNPRREGSALTPSENPKRPREAPASAEVARFAAHAGGDVAVAACAAAVARLALAPR